MFEAFKQAVEALVKKQLIMTVVSGTVKAVRDNVIDVSRNDLPDLLDVRFHAVIDDAQENRFKVVPKVGSEVLCAIIESDISEAYLLACSEVKTVNVKIGELVFDLQEEGVRITNQGQNLKKVLNDFQDGFGALCDEVNKIVVSVGVTPNVTAITGIKNNITGANKTNLNKILIE